MKKVILILLSLFTCYYGQQEPFKISEDVTGNPRQSYPDIFNADGDKMLVTWRDYTTGEIKREARYLNSDATPAGEKFELFNYDRIVHMEGNTYLGFKIMVSDTTPRDVYFNVYKIEGEDESEKLFTFAGYSNKFCLDCKFTGNVEVLPSDGGYFITVDDYGRPEMLRYDENGIKIAEYDFSYGDNDSQGHSSSAVISGGYALVFARMNNNDDLEIRGWFFDGEGKLLSGEADLEMDISKDDYDIDMWKTDIEIIPSTDSTYTVCLFDNPNDRILSAVYSRSGEKISELHSSVIDFSGLDLTYIHFLEMYDIGIGDKNGVYIYLAVDSHELYGKYVNAVILFEKDGSISTGYDYVTDFSPQGRAVFMDTGKHFLISHEVNDIFLNEYLESEFVARTKLTNDQGLNNSKNLKIISNDLETMVIYKDNGVSYKGARLSINNNDQFETERIELKSDNAILLRDGRLLNGYIDYMWPNYGTYVIDVYNSDLEDTDHIDYMRGKTYMWKVNRLYPLSHSFIAVSDTTDKKFFRYYDENLDIKSEKEIDRFDVQETAAVTGRTGPGFRYINNNNITFFDTLNNITGGIENPTDRNFITGTEDGYFLAAGNNLSGEEFKAYVVDEKGVIADSIDVSFNVDEHASVLWGDMELGIFLLSDNAIYYIGFDKPGRSLYGPIAVLGDEGDADRRNLSAGKIYDKPLVCWSEKSGETEEYDVMGLWIEDIDRITGIKGNDNNRAVPEVFSVSQNYPNPFNPSTEIRFTIPERNNVSLKVFNMIGEEVATLVNSEYEPGTYKIRFEAEGLPSGVYIYTVRAGEYKTSRKMILLK